MYSWEIKNFLEERNYYIGGDDLLNIISPIENPQFIYIKFNPFDNSYDIWDNEGNHFHFWTMPYEQAKEQGLVKKLLKK